MLDDATSSTKFPWIMYDFLGLTKRGVGKVCGFFLICTISYTHSLLRLYLRLHHLLYVV